MTCKSCNCARHGIRFLYRITLGLPDPHFYVPGAKVPSKLPGILNHDELVRLFNVTINVSGHLGTSLTPGNSAITQTHPSRQGCLKDERGGRWHRRFVQRLGTLESGDELTFGCG